MASQSPPTFLDKILGILDAVAEWPFRSLLPFRRKLVMVVGLPIEIVCRSVGEVHAECKEQLIEIFKNHQIGELIIK